MTTEQQDEAWLNIYGQTSHHSEAVIVGTHESLYKLAQSIIEAVALGKESSADFFASDGEGYEVIIRIVDSVGNMADPEYTDYLERVK
jgi:hypothetical protein